jgi:hypothetical protein
LLDHFSWKQGAIVLIIRFNICVLRFHSCACFVFLPSGPKRAGLSSNSAIKWDAFTLATSWSAPV